MMFIKNYISANCKTGLVLHIQNQFIKIHIKPATVLSTAFQNGMTLENRPKNEGLRANSFIW